MLHRWYRCIVCVFFFDIYIFFDKFACVFLCMQEAANFVVKKRNLKLQDRELRLCHCKPNSTPSKRSNPSPAEESSSPATKRPRTPDGNKSINRSASKSYQGLRASKSGVQKKAAKASRMDRFKTKIQKGEKERREKRPAVAARKAKAKALQNGGTAPKQAGVKRKPEHRTPESGRTNKKVKKFR